MLVASLLAIPYPNPFFDSLRSSQITQKGYSEIKKKRRSSIATKTSKRSTATRRTTRSSMKADGDSLAHSKFLPSAVKDIILSVHLEGLTDEEKKLLWMSRRELKDYPTALPTLLLAVDYGDRNQVVEAESLMEEWAESENPLDALQLLDVRYASPKVREYAVRMLNVMTDEELSEVMLQLVQVLKFEPHYDTALCRFLLRRSLLNPFVCGHALFWMLQSERHIADTKHHCRVLLELYLRNCGEHRVSLGHQMFIVNRLEDVAQIIKKTDGSNRGSVLREELKKIVFPKSFQVRAGGAK
jgi:phosphatidylinositol-4,5-bisphosphate 3-kinase